MESRALETERLTLRTPTLADFDDSRALWADPDVVRYTVGKPQTPDEVWARLLRYAGHWELIGYGTWVVREKSGRFVGEMGFLSAHRGLGPEFDEVPEAGWIVAPSAQQKGFATEAMIAAHRWLATTLAPRRTVCMINPANTRSIRLSERCGYRPWKEATFKGDAVRLFQRDGS